MSYGIAVWGFTYKSHIQKLSFLQKKIIRVIRLSKNKQNTPMLFSQNLNFSRLRIFVNCNYFHLYLIVKTKFAPVYFHDYFVQCSQVHNFNTRLASRGGLFLERKNTFQYGIRSIEYNGARLWNMLPVNLRASSSPSVFRSNLKKHFLSAYCL